MVNYLPAEYQKVEYIESTNAYPNVDRCLIRINDININSLNLKIKAGISNLIYKGRPSGEYMLLTQGGAEWRFLVATSNRMIASPFTSNNDITIAYTIYNDYFVVE